MTETSLPPSPCRACRDGKSLDFDFSMAFQPIVDLRERRLFAYEALVRGTDGSGAATILQRVDGDNRYPFDQACRVKADAALQAEALGMRVALLRTGLVLARDGGLLSRLLPLFRLGLGGRQGSGRQWMPWIHLDDQVALIDHLLQRPQASGPYNACAPVPVRNVEFVQALGRCLHRPAFLTVPAVALRLGLGELSGLLLGGQRALPARLLADGFDFRFSDPEAALADLLSARPAPANS